MQRKLLICESEPEVIGLQRWTGQASCLSDLIAQLEVVFGLTVSSVDHIECWDDEFEAWFGPLDLEQIPEKAKVRIRFEAATPRAIAGQSKVASMAFDPEPEPGPEPKTKPKLQLAPQSHPQHPPQPQQLPHPDVLSLNRLPEGVPPTIAQDQEVPADTDRTSDSYLEEAESQLCLLSSATSAACWPAGAERKDGAARADASTKSTRNQNGYEVGETNSSDGQALTQCQSAEAVVGIGMADAITLALGNEDYFTGRDLHTDAKPKCVCEQDTMHPRHTTTTSVVEKYRGTFTVLAREPKPAQRAQLDQLGDTTKSLSFRRNGRSALQRRLRKKLDSASDTLSFSLSHSAVLIAGAHDARKGPIEFPYDSLIAVSRRDFNAFQLTVYPRNSNGVPEIISFWGSVATVREIVVRLEILMEERRYHDLPVELLDQVQRWRAENDAPDGSHMHSGTDLPGISDALEPWIENALYSPLSSIHTRILKFHSDEFMALLQSGNASGMAPAVRNLMDELLDDLIDEINGVEASEVALNANVRQSLLNLPASPSTAANLQQDLLKRWIEAHLVTTAVTPIAAPLFSAVAYTHLEKDVCVGRQLVKLRSMPAREIAKRLQLPSDLFVIQQLPSSTSPPKHQSTNITDTSDVQLAYPHAIQTLCAVPRQTSPLAVLRSLRATLYAITNFGPFGPPIAANKSTTCHEKAVSDTIGADELVPIVVWVIVQSGVWGDPTAGANCSSRAWGTLQYVEEILTRADGSHTMSVPSDAQYCLATFQQALRLLENFDKDDTA